MNIRANSTAIAPYSKTSVSGFAGTGPYTYMVLTPNGGTVTSDGLYTAPQNFGSFIVKATDSLGDSATITIRVMEALQLLCDVIATELGLESDQVILWNQKFPTLQKRDRLYIAVGVLTSKPFSNIRKSLPNGEVIQAMNVRTIVSLDIMSYGPEARHRKEEVVMALGSVYAEQQQATNSFSIAKIPAQFVNLSVEEGSEIPYRFSTTASLQYMVQKQKAAAYYDTFENVEFKIEGDE